MTMNTVPPLDMMRDTLMASPSSDNRRSRTFWLRAQFPACFASRQIKPYENDILQ